MNFLYLRPQELSETLQALAQYGGEAKLLAGGTALVIMLGQKLLAPQVLIDLGGLPGLSYARVGADGHRLGAMVRLREVERLDSVRQAFPGLASACHEVGNVRVRNQATLGGNLAEADYASDPPAMLLALNAQVSLHSLNGERLVPLSEFFLGFYTTATREDELITEILIPPLPEGARSVYLKYKSRSSEDRPCVGVAAVGIFSGEVCQELRLAVGAACELPSRLAEFESLASGERLSDELVAEIAEGYMQKIETLDDLRGSAWYRKQMIRVFVKRALEEVRGGSG
jgi:carbon-monoxide dehydrogenase medium subunit